MTTKALFGAIALLSLMGLGRVASADVQMTTESTTAAAASDDATATAATSQDDTVLMMNADTKQVIRVDKNGNVTPVSADELKTIAAQDQAKEQTQQTLDSKELWGHFGGFGGWHHGFGGGWHHGFGGFHHGWGHGGFWEGGGWHHHYWHRHGWYGGRWAPFHHWCRWHYCG